MKKWIGIIVPAVAVLIWVLYAVRRPEPAQVPDGGDRPAEEAPASSPAAPVQKSIQPEGPVLKAMEAVIGQPVSPAGIILITDFRTRLSVGDTLRTEAKVMGSLTPFEARKASFLVGDELTVASCDLLGVDERCPTPWDVHHEDTAAVRDGLAVVVITDDRGQLLPAAAKGVKGLRELRRLRIEGELIEMETGAYPVIRARAIQFLD